MSRDDNDGQIIFGDLEGMKLPDICLAGEEKPRKYSPQELNISSIRVFDQIREPEIPITLRPHQTYRLKDYPTYRNKNYPTYRIKDYPTYRLKDQIYRVKDYPTYRLKDQTYRLTDTQHAAFYV